MINLISNSNGFHNPDPSMVWIKYCSFLDMSLNDFMDIQEELLKEQLNLTYDSVLGRRLLTRALPKSVEEFRKTVPLTTYGDYQPFLAPGNDGVLAERPIEWAHTTGAQADFKWIPYTQRGLERLLDNLMGAFILAAAKGREDVRIWPGDTVLFNAPARPYVSGLAAYYMAQRFGLRGVIDPETSEHMEFKERVRQSFHRGLGMKVDVIGGMTSVLVKVGEGFAEESRKSSFDRSMLRPRALLRLTKAYSKSKLFRRQVLPKDLWPTKAILGWGIDTPFFRDRVKYYWGKEPFEMYACTEGGIMGMQTWRKQGVVFNPYSDFFEFIPMEENLKAREDDRYIPKTVLLNEVQPDREYEVVITNFYAMPFIRYKVGHYVRFLPREKWEDDIRLPQFVLQGRADDRIDLAGFTRLDEKTVWEALDLSGLRYEDWTVRKEFSRETPLLHLYIELKENRDGQEAEQVIHEALRRIDSFYGDLEGILDISPLRITVLAPSTFERFYEMRLKEGYHLGKRRPPHMNPTDTDIQDLLKVSRARALVA